MKSFSAIILKSIFVSIYLGTALTDPNFGEFCSKEYFDRIITKTVDKLPVIEFYRKDETKNKSNHKWTAYLMDNQTTGYYHLLDLSYLGLKSRSQFVLDINLITDLT